MKKGVHLLEVLINKYLKGQSSSKESRLLDEFAAPQDTQLWDEHVHGHKEAIRDQMLSHIDAELSSDTKVRSIHPIRIGLSAAASIALLVGVFFWFFSPSTETYQINTLSQMDSVRMPDGSTIYLGANTSLFYSANYNKDTREVKLLKGNAFFDVAKNPDKPFIITSGEVKTTVLGTSFNISMEGDNCQVTVHSGKVNVASGSHSVNLLPNEEASFTAQDRLLAKRPASHSYLTQWHQQDLELKNVRLEEVLEVLKYKFGAVTDIKDTMILDTKVTVFIAQDANLQRIIEQLNYITSNLKIDTYEGVVTIR